MTDTIENLLEYYANLLIIQYRNKPKAINTIKAFARQILADMLPIKIRDAYTVDTAEGKQLDVLGKYIGFSRFISTLVVKNFFKFNVGPNITAINGFNTYQQGLIRQAWMKYSDFDSQDYPLGDSDLRVMLKLKSIINNGSAITSEIKTQLYNVFGDSIKLTDNRNMTYTYTVSEDLIDVLPVILAYDMLPVPMGVSYSVQIG
ncbi:hypothetical protein AAIR98_000916 [Elusimicrobium simillimum]|uniref:DUF2612 domain-containing protein n=1 Tax=Elusimicrobium simillimum TaxID=3143438 RepID=UPI003C6FA887